MNLSGKNNRLWRVVAGLAAPLLLWSLFAFVLFDALRFHFRGNEEYDEAALREWVEESRVFRETLPEMVRGYLGSAESVDGSPENLLLQAQEIREQLRSLCNPTRMYQSQLPLFPAVYRLELEFHPRTDLPLPAIVWESEVPRPRQTSQIRRLDHFLLGSQDHRAVLRFEYQLHAYNKRQRDEQDANLRLRWVTGLACAATALTAAWIFLTQRRQQERQRQQALAQSQIDHAERLLLKEELRRQKAEHLQEEAERKLLEQRLATQAAEQVALELKSHLYASIGIMAGSYAHNIKNLLVRPNDLLNRCLDAKGMSPDQYFMLREVRQTLGIVTERLQQILRTVRRDPDKSEMARLDLNAVARDIFQTWEELAREKWKMSLRLELNPEPLWINGDWSHLQQAAENLLFNARDATFEMRNFLRDQARHADNLDPAARRQALIDAAAWRGSARIGTRRAGEKAVLEVEDNGIGMTEEVRRRCTETHFTTKRDNALYEGNSTGMGLGLSFVTVILGHHHATLAIESQPQRGTLFLAEFPVINRENCAPLTNSSQKASDQANENA